VTEPILRVLVVDGAHVIRLGLRAYLEDAGFVVTSVPTGEAALRLIRSFAPDVVITEVDLPGMSGIDLARHAAGARVLVFTADADAATVVAAVRAGSSGYVLKDVEHTEVVAAVRALAAGHVKIDPRVAGALVAEVREAPAAVQLEHREREVLELLAGGLANCEIGAQLYMSPSAVKKHVSRVLEKLGAENRVQAAAYAIRHGVVAA
jgi:DNA-binding NarL/FixJ family response regulator